MLSTMARIQVLGARRCLDPVVRRLHDLGMVQIAEGPNGLDPAEAILRRGSADTAEKARLESLISRASSLLSLLPAEPAAPTEPTPADSRETAAPAPDLTAFESLLAQIEPVCAESVVRRSALEGELAGLRQYRLVVTYLGDLLDEPIRLAGFETTALVVREKHRTALDLIAAELGRLTQERYEMISADVGGDSSVALVIYPRGSAAAVHALLQGESLSEIELPAEFAGVPFAEARESIQRREREIAAEAAALDQGLAEVAARNRQALRDAQSALADRLAELAVEGSLAESEHVFVLEGWAPRKHLGRIRATLAEVSEATEVVEIELTEEEHGAAPVLLENWPIVRPFEFLMGILSPPRYGTIDPTPLMAVFFPLFFGMILGDVAYGLILVAASLYILRRPSKPRWLDQLSRIFLICSVPTIAFGFAYGEFLGSFGEHLGLHPLIVDRMDAFVPMLAFSIAVGAFHVVLGLVLGMVNAYLERKRREILDKATMLVALVALFVVVGAAADLLPREVLTPGIAALLVALVILIASVGIVGPLEVFGAVGNILSYSRLMAIGLSSVVLAKVANDLAGLTGSVLLGVIVAGLFHALNVALGVFSPSIQSMRLHFVEFFGKFYESGGERFHPFHREGLASIPTRTAQIGGHPGGLS